MLPHLKDYFTRKDFSAKDFPLRVHAPGRINLIGEHTDYTGGLVLPASIDKGIEFYARRIDEAVLRLHAVDLEETADVSLPVTGKSGTLWVDYLAGVTEQFQQLGHGPVGLEVVFGGDLPRGSGMSSSAALESGLAFMWNEVLGTGLDRPYLAKLCQRSSNTFIGVPTGIMDQFASLNGSAQGPILLHCSTLEFSPVNAGLIGYRWLLINSMVSHELTGSAYPDRVRQCGEALRIIRESLPDTSSLGTLRPEQFARVADTLPDLLRRRARHVVSENDRVRTAREALEAGNAPGAGDLLNASHTSLRDDYEVSCAEVDFLQHEVVTHFPEIVAGSRIMGGGFGGCTINLVKTGGVATLKAHLCAAYSEKFGLDPEFYPVAIGPGVRLI